MSDFGELSDLLEESMVQDRERKAVVEAKKRVKQVTGVTAAERAEDATRIIAWESQHVWRGAANVARFEVQVCKSCGEEHTIFSGLFERQEHRHLAHHSQRWIRATGTKAALPNEIILAKREVPMCIDCCDWVGFDYRNATWENGQKVEWEDGEGDGESCALPNEEPQADLPREIDNDPEEVALLADPWVHSVFLETV